MVLLAHKYYHIDKYYNFFKNAKSKKAKHTQASLLFSNTIKLCSFKYVRSMSLLELERSINIFCYKFKHFVVFVCLKNWI